MSSGSEQGPSSTRAEAAAATDHRDWIVKPGQQVLVTGANGFIGTRVVKVLLERGFEAVRCLVRPSGSLRGLQEVIAQGGRAGQAVEILRGNLINRDDCMRAVDGAAVVFHLAAGIDKSYAGCYMNSVLTTRNLLDAAVAGGILKRFVNVSSFAVYSNLKLKRGALLDESTGLEDDFQARHDPYGYGKRKQEQIVEQYHQKHALPYVTIRPGAVFGPGKTALTGRIGIDTFGIFLHLGGSNPIPFTYVDNCADAIYLAGVVPGVEGETFNVVDDDVPGSRSFLRGYKRHAGRFWSVPVPYPVTSLLCTAWEAYSRRTSAQLPPAFNARRCSAEWKGNRYSNEKLKRMLNWKPRVPMEEATKLYFESLRPKA